MTRFARTSPARMPSLDLSRGTAPSSGGTLPCPSHRGRLFPVSPPACACFSAAGATLGNPRILCRFLKKASRHTRDAALPRAFEEPGTLIALIALIAHIWHIFYGSPRAAAKKPALSTILTLSLALAGSGASSR